MMRSILLVGVLATSIACATAGTSASGTTASGVRRDPNVITEQEIATSNGSNAYEVISRVRPTFLKQRGQTTITQGGSMYATVYVNSQQYGDVTSLRGISADQIREIRYYSASDAVSRFGSQNGTGVIQVITK
jgi:hypothetical protein